MQPLLCRTMKRLSFLVFLCLCWAGQLPAQEKIDIYDAEQFPESVSELGLHGPVKSVKYITRIMKADTVREEYGQTLYFNHIGLLVKRMYVSYGNVGEEDPCIFYTYDSLGRFESAYTLDGTFFQKAVYDSHGRFSHSVYTRRDGIPKPSRRYFYDEQGRCIRNEYRPTDDEYELDYLVMQHPFLYDSVGHCIETAEIVDGDTLTVKTIHYDTSGRVVERMHVFFFMEPDRHLYDYDKDGKLIREQYFYDGKLSSTSFHEYDEQNRMKITKEYDKDGNITDIYRYSYDSFGNKIECVIESWKQGQKQEWFVQSTAEYEYWE